MSETAYLLLAAAAISFLFLPRFRRDMLLGGVFALPAPLLFPLMSPTWRQVAGAANAWLTFFSWRAAFALAVGALAVLLYSLLLRRLVSPRTHPERHRLRLLWSAIILAVLAGLFRPPFLLLLSATLSYGLLAILLSNRRLIWDYVASGLGFGLLYVGVFTALYAAVPGLWSPTGGAMLSGVTLFSLPIEAVLGAFLAGAVVGPVYLSYKEREEHDEDPAAYLRPKRMISLVALALGVLAALYLATLLLTAPAVSASPADHATSASLSQPLRFTFSHPVDQRRVRLSIDPPVAGTLSFSGRRFNQNLYSQASFQPDQPLRPGVTYTVLLSLGTGLGGTQQHLIAFSTAPAPVVSGTQPATGAKGVPVCQPIVFQLDRPNDDAAQFTFSSSPAASFTTTLSGDHRSYSLLPSPCLLQGAPYVVTATRTLGSLPPEKMLDLPFTTLAPPQISSYSPSGSGVSLATKAISLTFSQPMQTSDPSGRLSISPSVPASWRWQDATTLIGSLGGGLSPSTTYTVTVGKGLPTLAKGTLNQDAAVSFVTLGPPAVTSSSPANGSRGVSVGSSVSLTFSPGVDRASAEAAFSMSPAVTGSMSWSGSTLTFKPASPLSRDASYAVTVKAGVLGAEGLVSSTAFTTSFSTEQSVTLLSVPLHYQQHALSCESAALTMALDYRGTGATESQVIAAVGFDPTPHQGGVWGDPTSAFVGDIDGRQDTTGYGVYAGPIARAAQRWRQAQAFTGWSLSQAAQALADGNPVVVWGVYPPASRDSWQTPAGDTVSAWKGEHARTLIGFTGTVDNPTSFTLNDPIAGRITWTAAQFKANWAYFDDMGVVVY